MREASMSRTLTCLIVGISAIRPAWADMVQLENNNAVDRSTVSAAFYAQMTGNVARLSASLSAGSAASRLEFTFKCSDQINLDDLRRITSAFVKYVNVTDDIEVGDFLTGLGYKDCKLETMNAPPFRVRPGGS